MIDLSNNNATGHNFEVIYKKAGQRRVYLKLVEGTNFHDQTYSGMANRAIAAHLKVGAYDFLHPVEHTPAEALKFFTDALPHPLDFRKHCRPCFDVEYGHPSSAVGHWVSEIVDLFRKHFPFYPLIYGSGYYLEDCHIPKQLGPLWLAAYGRNDGREYPVDMVPHPWKRFAAHQFTSVAHVLGVSGDCDLSHVYSTSGVDIPRPKGV